MRPGLLGPVALAIAWASLSLPARPAAAAGWGPLPARYDGRDPATIDRPRSITLEPEAGGEHWRFETWNGPVHLWFPAGYDADTAGTVLYVHGFYVDVDKAWREHELARQFAASGINAIFIAPEAPIQSGDLPRWADLGVLLGEVEKRLQVPLPRGPVVAMGHSAAHRTIVEWLAYRPLAEVVLIDALYAGEELFHAWLEAQPWAAAGTKPVRGRRARAALPQKRMVLVVGRSSAATTQEFLRPVRRLVVRVNEVPASPKRITKKMRAARILSVRSSLGHFELVTTGAVIPVILHATRLGDRLIAVAEPPKKARTRRRRR